MATISGVQGSWQVDLVVNEVATNIEKNTSSANWSLIIRRTDSGSYPMYGTPTINISISGKTAYKDSKYFAISSINKNGVTLLSGTVTDIEHNDNGTIKNNTASFTWSGSGFNPNNVSGSGKYTTSTIPRASSIAVSNYNLGQNISVTIGKKVNSFTSTLTYKIGSRTGTLIEKTTEPSFVWQMPEELISQIKLDNPSNKAPEAIIYCDTYSGDTQIGTTQQAKFTLTITDKPTINNVVINETIELIKKYTTSIVKYLSVPQFNITANPSEGTTISTYKVKIGDKEISSNTNGVTINNIQYSYLVDDARKTKFIITVTDARGNVSDEYPLEVDFIEYVQLAFNNTDIQLKRLNSASNYMKLHATGYIYNGLIGETQNKLTLQYRYKLKNDTTAEWSELKIIETTVNDDNTFIIDNLQLEDEFDYRENYDIEFYANDLFLSTDYRTVIKTSETIAKWHKNGAYIKEISASKINLNKVDLFAPSYCMMRTSSKINFDSGNRVKVTGMGAGWEVGDYYIDDNDIVVSNTTILEMSSVLAGYGAVSANIQVYTEDTYYSSSSGCLLEGYGRGYFRIKGETFTLQLDPTKTYRVSLWASGYNDKKFEMNNGFGDKSTQLFVRKIL